MNRHIDTFPELEDGLEGEGASYHDGETGNGNSLFAGSDHGNLGFSVIVGVFVGFEDAELPLVNFAENETGEPVSARSTVRLSRSDIGSEVAIAFDRGDLTKPIILGCLGREVANEPQQPPELQSTDKLVL